LISFLQNNKKAFSFHCTTKGKEFFKYKFINQNILGQYTSTKE
jgi:hypothetical protein